MRFRLTWLLGAALCVAALAVARGQQGTFVPDGVYPTTSRAGLPPGVHTLGSWVGGDQFQGRQESAWVPATSTRMLYIAGFPSGPGMSLQVQWRLADGKVVAVPFQGTDAGEHWWPWKVEPPPGAKAVRWVAEDRSSELCGWLGVSDFVKPQWSVRFAPLPARVALAFAVVGLLLALGMVAVRGCCDPAPGGRAAAVIPEDLWPIVAAAGVAAAGYLVLWVWFWSPRAGGAASWLLLALFTVAGVWRLALRRGRISWLIPLGLAVAAGALYLIMLLWYPALNLDVTVSQRFVHLPGDNTLPRLFAEKFIRSEGPRPFADDWLSSDRPPLQSGWILLFWPVLECLQVDLVTAANVAGCWFQLLWCLAFWGLVRSFGLSRAKSAAVVGAAIPIGLLLLNSIFTWPKLSAAALVIGGVTLGFFAEPLPPDRSARFWRYGVVGALLALGWLSHGGAAFAILGAAPLLVWRLGSPWSPLAVFRKYPGWRNWAAAAAFAIFAAPWLAYQRFYDPPGNRLLKMHLAGVEAVDSRGLAQTLIQEYRALGWRGALDARWKNIALQGWGDWLHFFRFDHSGLRRTFEWEFYLRSAGFYLPAALAAWLFIAARRTRRTDLKFGPLGGCAIWVLSTWAVWIALMFKPNSTVAHQGTYTIALGLYALLLTGLIAELPLLFCAAVAAQSVYFLAIWLPR